MEIGPKNGAGHAHGRDGNRHAGPSELPQDNGKRQPDDGDGPAFDIGKSCAQTLLVCRRNLAIYAFAETDNLAETILMAMATPPCWAVWSCQKPMSAMGWAADILLKPSDDSNEPKLKMLHHDQYRQR
ncbi:hypothetical protein [uncultured Roseobacter sp.]|uniref:hypothetical protein n=1 Tax=uncultured Roseobacter sp. TaxID=114847 RepID=UPI002634F518|nr:hypothetical protein [uncultured Roseobacter sp.]